MKKKILLSVFSVFSIMIASKSFAQSYHTTYVKQEHHGFHSDIRDIRHDQANINYDLSLIDQKKAEMQKDRAFHNRFAYREDKRSLNALYNDLASDRNKLAIDMRANRIDGRVASSRRF